MVSIKDIAAECGVSIATVSKALNNHRDVSETTRKSIQEKAKEMGYLPNSQARALKTNRTYNLGVLFAERSGSGLKQNYFAGVLDGFKREAEKNGYDITFISGNIGTAQMTYYEHCIYRNVDGVVVACVDDYLDSGVIELIESSVPVVAIDYVPQKKLSVISDNYMGMAELTEYILDMGHKDIAYIYGDDSQVTEIRKRSFIETVKSRNIEVRDDFLVKGCYHDPRKTELLVKSLLSGPKEDRPTCIILPDDFAALGAYNAVEELGLSVPDDVSIAGYDGIVLSQTLRPKLTTLRQDTDRLGAEAARRLIALIKKEISGDDEPMVIKGELIKGASVRKLD
ncbi:MAG: LacI family DNA-binding transcriptional regulator [Oscillospiraceae bacterium]|nr:LacI family DNA-binding transcriptional regulator [Oscillospiraceae bacterium]